METSTPLIMDLSLNGWGKSKGIERQNVLNIIFNGIKVKHNVY